MLRPLLLLTCAAMLLTWTSAAWGAGPRVAGPASATVVGACSERAAANAPTAHVEQVVRGVGTLGGCVADASGIAHLLLRWETADGTRHGRICADPPVRGGAWTCAWDTTELEPGSYVVVMTAIDPVGNRGSFEQAYRVEAAPRQPEQPTHTPEPEPATEPQPETDPEPAPDPIPDSPTVAVPVAQLVDERVADCAQLELAPGVVADRALSLAVLDCMRPALELVGSTTIGLDEVPVPPSIRLAFTDVDTLAAADELLPESIGGVAIELVLEPTLPEPIA